MQGHEHGSDTLVLILRYNTTELQYTGAITARKKSESVQYHEGCMPSSGADTRRLYMPYICKIVSLSKASPPPLARQQL